MGKCEVTKYGYMWKLRWNPMWKHRKSVVRICWKLNSKEKELLYGISSTEPEALLLTEINLE